MDVQVITITARMQLSLVLKFYLRCPIWMASRVLASYAGWGTLHPLLPSPPLPRRAMLKSVWIRAWTSSSPNPFVGQLLNRFSNDIVPLFQKPQKSQRRMTNQSPNQLQGQFHKIPNRNKVNLGFKRCRKSLGCLTVVDHSLYGPWKRRRSTHPNPARSLPVPSTTMYYSSSMVSTPNMILLLGCI